MQPIDNKPKKKRELDLPPNVSTPILEPKSSGKIYNVLLGFLLVGLLLGGIGALWFYRDSIFSTEPSSNKTTNADLPKNLDSDSLEEIYDTLRGQYDGSISYEDIMTELRHTLVDSLDDPHSTYMTDEAFQSFLGGMQGSIVGIGAFIKESEDSEDPYPIIMNVIPETPAERYGLKNGDVILKVDNQSMANLPLAEVTDSIKGPKGTEVTLMIRRETIENKVQTMDITLIRDEFSVPSVLYETKGEFGILTINSFTLDDEDIINTTDDLVVKAAQMFVEEEVKGVILDLRHNPGGSLEATIPVSSVWLEPQEIVLKESFRDDLFKNHHAVSQSTSGILANIPLVILANRGTASASEIVIGALRYHHEDVTLIGQKTFGKDKVQSLLNLEKSGYLKLTTRHWLTPAEKSVAGGIAPDEIIEDDPLTENIDEVIVRALEILESKTIID